MLLLLLLFPKWYWLFLHGNLETDAVCPLVLVALRRASWCSHKARTDGETGLLLCCLPEEDKHVSLAFYSFHHLLLQKNSSAWASIDSSSKTGNNLSETDQLSFSRWLSENFMYYFNLQNHFGSCFLNFLLFVASFMRRLQPRCCEEAWLTYFFSISWKMCDTAVQSLPRVEWKEEIHVLTVVEVYWSAQQRVSPSGAARASFQSIKVQTWCQMRCRLCFHSLFLYCQLGQVRPDKLIDTTTAEHTQSLHPWDRRYWICVCMYYWMCV